MAKGFNKDMDRYLRGRTENRISFRFGKKTRVERVPAVKEGEVTIEHSEPGFWSRLFRKAPEPVREDLTDEERAKLEAMERDIAAVEEAEAESTDPEEIEMLEEAREGMLSRFFQSLRLFQTKHRVDDEAIAVMEAEEQLEKEKAQMETEVKEVLKITHKWLGKLTKRYREEFLDSKDYARYVAVLEKYGVAKKK